MEEKLLSEKLLSEESPREKLLLKRLLKDLKRLKASQGYLYAGIPNYARLFGRDSCIAALQLLDLFPDIAKSTLEILAKYQGKKINFKAEEEPGKILHEHYINGWLEKSKDFLQSNKKSGKIPRFFNWDFPYYGSIDSTAWWLILFSKYIKKTNDEELKQKLQPNIEKAFSWIENFGDLDDDSFIESYRKNPFGSLHQGWKDGLTLYIRQPIAMVEVQGYYYCVYREFGLEEKAQELKEKFNEQFWMPQQNYFALALDEVKKQIKIITSNPGHLLFTGILDNDKVEKVVKRLFEEDLWTPYGIRTHSSKDSRFDSKSYHQGSVWPHDNWIIYEGLLKYGYQKEAQMIKDALISAYQTLGYIPELYEVKDNKIFPIKISCYLQAWSTGALINLLTSKDNQTVL